MLEWPENFIPSFLIDADQEAQKARDMRLSELFHQPHTLWRLRSMLADPFYRPLMELDRNSATDFASALVLKQRGFIETRELTARFGELSGHRIETVEITQEGFEFLYNYHATVDSLNPDIRCDAGELMHSAVLAYMARDLGYGIVVTRDLAEVAIEIEDGDVLRRMMSLMRFSRQLRGAPDDLVDAIEQRRDAQDYWAPRSDGERTGYQIIDLFMS
ncbi:hypothetical protein AB4874_19390 [Thioclava sp. 15-R06ZXC-3]|uniref:Uncharacterized protein n=1 Tax=Thioclava arctica TaxID=3238301 RepID=A0ABV3TQA9_9RHOB